MGKTEQRIAEFIVETDINDIPAESFTSVREGVFDCIGVTLAGAAQPHGALIRNFAVREGQGASSIVGDARTTSLSMAGLANGTLGHALDYDDMGGGFGHPSVILTPTALTVGEYVGASGHELLAAYIIGFEVGRSVSRGMPYHQGERGFHSTGTFGTLTSTAIACRMLGLTVDQTIMALGAAGSMPSGVLQNFGTYTKPLHAGLANRNGITAALLARDGWLASDFIFESKVGFAAAYAGADNVNVEAMTKDLGSKWATAEGLVIKKYPCCGSNHSALDSVIALVREHGIKLEDIEEVEVTGFPAISHVLLYPEPSYAFQGKFSVHYNVATALIDGKIDMDSYSDERLSRPEFLQALNKIEIKTMSNWDPGYRAAPHENPVTIRLKNGQVLTRSTNRHHMHGTPADPLTLDELHGKFRHNARYVLSAEQADEALRLWWNIDNVGNVREAIAAVAGAAVEAREPVGATTD